MNDLKLWVSFGILYLWNPLTIIFSLPLKKKILITEKSLYNLLFMSLKYSNVGQAQRKDLSIMP